MSDAIINLSLNFEHNFPPPSRMITKLLLLKLASHMIPSHSLKNQTGLEIVNQVNVENIFYAFFLDVAKTRIIIKISSGAVFSILGP